ncbi:hypothetical protein SAMN05421767_15016 [Granulicatella balaenopterae]|uniref:Uncharacterized protein n=1 Tax=Granulicatella balaenopterae TaxID=137733 RepID=A0A1H9P3Z4_9LACT|nr:hypothetical protein [Granulicatella balaenopterae]SER43014.1 hypothetical protein SAMN05421767_15016 [Granulicatella balaenopterae]
MLTKNMTDWIFRYQYVYRKRYTNKQKEKFLHAFVADLSQLTNQIKVVSSEEGVTNVYVGNIQKASRVICTGYDTPLDFKGDYLYFNQKRYAKKSLQYLYAKLAIIITLGGSVIFLGNKFIKVPSLVSIPSVVIAMITLVYFYYLGKIARGDSKKNTAVCNTFSIVYLLNRISKGIESNEAYAFLDATYLGDKGKQMLKNASKNSVEIVQLNGIGAFAPIHFVKMKYEGKQKWSNIIAAHLKENEGMPVYYLTSKELQTKMINSTQFEEVDNLLY